MTRPKNDKRDKLWFDPYDDDALVEDWLTRAGLYPLLPQPIDIERFIEGYLKCSLDQYANLGPLVQGQTEFFVNGSRPHIQINKIDMQRADAEQGTALHRVRMTMAHEACHVIKHSHLFIPSPDPNQPCLPNSGMGASGRRLLRCYNVAFPSAGPRGPHDPREVEANNAMGALLMPRELFTELVEELFDGASIPQSCRHLKDRRVWSVVAQVSELMQVSKQAVEIRMERLELLELPALPGQEEFRFAEEEDEDDSF